MKVFVTVVMLLTSQLSFGDVISEDKAISIHGNACSAQAGFTKSVFDRNIQVDFDDVFMEYNISSTLLFENGNAMVCNTSVAQSGKVETVDVVKVPTI